MTEPIATDVITDSDLTGLNQRALLRSTDRVRTAGTVLLGIGALLAAAWLWQLLRAQGIIGNSSPEDFGGVFVGESLTWKTRVDLLSATLTNLGFAAVVAGLGMGLRIYSDALTLRAGGTLTGWEVGDHIDPPDDDQLVRIDQA